MADSEEIFDSSFLGESVVFIQDSELDHVQEAETVLVQHEGNISSPETDGRGHHRELDTLQLNVGASSSTSDRSVLSEGQPDTAMLDSWTMLEQGEGDDKLIALRTGAESVTEDQAENEVETLTLVLEEGSDFSTLTRQFVLATGGDLYQAEQQIRAILLAANQDSENDIADGIQFPTSESLADEAATFLNSGDSPAVIDVEAIESAGVAQTWTESVATADGGDPMNLVDDLITYQHNSNRSHVRENEVTVTSTSTPPQTTLLDDELEAEYDAGGLASELDFVTELQPPSTIEAEAAPSHHFSESMDGGAERAMSETGWHQLESNELEITATTDGPFGMLETPVQVGEVESQPTDVETDSREVQLPAQLLQQLVDASAGGGDHVFQVTTEDSQLINMLGGQGTIFVDMDGNRQRVLHFVQDEEDSPKSGIGDATPLDPAAHETRGRVPELMSIDNDVISEQSSVDFRRVKSELVNHGPLLQAVPPNLCSRGRGRGRISVRSRGLATRGGRPGRTPALVRPMVERDSGIATPPATATVRQPLTSAVGGLLGRAFSHEGSRARPCLLGKHRPPSALVAKTVSSSYRKTIKMPEVSVEQPSGGVSVDLVNTTQNDISPQNMEAIVQILQSLPRSAQGHTIQVVLQNTALLPEEVSPVSNSVISSTQSSIPKFTKSSPFRRYAKGGTTSGDIGIQVPSKFASPFVGNVTAATGSSAMDGHSINVTKEGELNSVTSAILDEMQMDMSDMQDVELFDCSVLPIIPPPVASRKTVSANRRRSNVSNKIVTVKEEWVVNPKPGVSYYAVIDYLSEPEHDGASSSTNTDNRFSALSSFMEDHLELLSLPGEAKGRSVLESTVDSNLIAARHRRSSAARKAPPSCKTPPLPVVSHHSSADNGAIDLVNMNDQSSVTLPERSPPSKQPANRLSEVVVVSAEPTVPRTLKRRSSRITRDLSDRKEYRCGYCQFSLADKIEVVEHCIREHPQMPIKTMSLSAGGGRTCPYCREKFEYAEFFTHMRFEHNEFHPYKCGYCEFMARDRNQVRHHIQKKHRLPLKVVDMTDAGQQQQKRLERASDGRRRIMPTSEGEDSVYEYMTDEEEDACDEEDDGPSRDLACPECSRSFKVLKYLKTHIKVHQPHRYQCGYCDFISVMLHQVIQHCHRRHTEMEPRVLSKELDPDKHPIISRDMASLIRKVFSLNTRLPRDPDAAKWMRKWCCPHCDYTCRYGASFRRHIKMHENKLPYKCNYCSFKGREKYYVRRHIYRIHQNVPLIVVENTAENRACDSSSDEDFQQKGLRRKRRRRTKDNMRTVVPLESMDDTEFMRQFLKLPVGDRGKKVRPSREQPNRTKRMPRLPRSKEWTVENVADYVLARNGDQVSCNVCSESVHAMSFARHAKQHFKVRPKPLKCGHCNFMSIKRVGIRMHSELKHPGAPLKIEECHLASVAPRDFLDLLDGGGDEGGRPAIAEDDTPQLCCSLCQATVPCVDSLLREHFYTHYDFRPFECNLCDFRGVTEESVLTHGDMHAAPVVVRRIDEGPPDGLEDAIQYFLQEGRRAIQLQARVAPNLRQASHLFHCPLCEQTIKLHVVTVRRHLYNHFQYRPWKCGFCQHLGISKASIRKHSSVHGGVAPRVEFVGDAMPKELASLLANIKGSVQDSADTLPLSQEVLTETSQNPVTDEGRQWKEKLVRGECPMCGTKIVGPVYAHLAEHFNQPTISCGHCQEVFPSEPETIQHNTDAHPDLEPIVVVNLSTDDEAAVRQGLLRHLKSSGNVATKIPIALKCVDRIAANKNDLPAAEKEDQSSDAGVDIMIVNEEGDVIGNTTASIQNVATIKLDASNKDETVLSNGADLTTSRTTLVDPGETTVDIPSGTQAGDNSEEILTAKTDEQNVEASNSAKTKQETASERVALAVDGVHSGEVTAHANENKSSDAEKTGEIGSEQPQPDTGAPSTKRGLKASSKANIVTVEGVLLTRSFQSETEVSDDDGDDEQTDFGGGTSFGGQGSGYSDDDRDSSSNDDRSAAEEEDDDEEMLISNLTSDFFGDVVNLLKQQRELQQSGQSSQLTENSSHRTGHSGLECNICHWRFAMLASLEAHVHEVHGTSESTPDIDPRLIDIQLTSRPPRRRRIANSVPNVTIKRRVLSVGEPASEGTCPNKRERVGPKLPLNLSVIQASSTVPVAEEPAEEDEETVENITKMLNEHVDAGSGSVVALATNSDVSDILASHSPSVTTVTSDINGAVPTIATTEMESFLASTSDAVDPDAMLDGLENLEECDANLPKILEILQLKSHDDNKFS